MTNNEKIKELKEMIEVSDSPCFSKFKCLESTKEYFNDYGLCGVVFEDGKYVWCHQDYPMGGDKPHNYFCEITFYSLDELVEYVIKRYHLK